MDRRSCFIGFLALSIGLANCSTRREAPGTSSPTDVCTKVLVHIERLAGSDPEKFGLAQIKETRSGAIDGCRQMPDSALRSCLLNAGRFEDLAQCQPRRPTEAECTKMIAHVLTVAAKDDKKVHTKLKGAGAAMLDHCRQKSTLAEVTCSLNSDSLPKLVNCSNRGMGVSQPINSKGGRDGKFGDPEEDPNPGKFAGGEDGKFGDPEEDPLKDE